jgi:hypothetical protein
VIVGESVFSVRAGMMEEFHKAVRDGLTSREARICALWELSRRAGITREQFGAWRIETHADRDVIWLEHASSDRIIFPVASQAFWKKLRDRKIEVARASWMFRPPQAIADAVPNLIVPFSNEIGQDEPLFSAIDAETVCCSIDLLSSILLTLSRYEEAIAETRDDHGRFPAHASLAAIHGFLDRPIVDEYGLAFEQVFSYLMPGWTAPVRELRVKLSHDVDEVGIPFRIRPLVGHTVARHNPLATLRDLASAGGIGEPSYLRCVRKICQLSLERELDSALYWKSPPYTDYDSGYSLHESRTQAVVRWAGEQGIEMGAHPGYYTYHSRQSLREQFEYIRGAVDRDLIGGRQHYLRWSPESWEDWEECGFAYDSTVGYADRIGFRAGTCIPYRPWLLRQARLAKLLEIPLIVMDSTVAVYMALPPEEQFQRILSIVSRCRLVGGVFTLLWHNTSLMEPCFGNTYIRLINGLAGSKRFQWKDDVEDRDLNQPRIACA